MRARTRQILERWRETKRRHAWLRWAEDGALLVVVLSVVLAWQTRSLVGSGETAPAFALTDLQGQSRSLASLQGKPTLLYFWAPWCGVCGAQSSNIQAVQEALGDEVNVVSVALGYRNVASVGAFVAKHDVKYPVLLGTERTAKDYRIEVFPTVYFLGEDGRVKRTAVGYTSTLGLRWRLWW